MVVIGDGAVELLAVPREAAGRRTDRADGATRRPYRPRPGVRDDRRGRQARRGGIARVREVSEGSGAHEVIDVVGHLEAYRQAIGVFRPGGTISRVGVPQYEDGPIGLSSVFGRSLTITGGSAGVRQCIELLLPAILAGEVEPGKVIARAVGLDEVPDLHRAMDARNALKVLVVP